MDSDPSIRDTRSQKHPTTLTDLPYEILLPILEEALQDLYPADAFEPISRKNRKARIPDWYDQIHEADTTILGLRSMSSRFVHVLGMLPCKEPHAAVVAASRGYRTSLWGCHIFCHTCGPRYVNQVYARYGQPTIFEWKDVIRAHAVSKRDHDLYNMIGMRYYWHCMQCYMRSHDAATSSRVRRGVRLGGRAVEEWNWWALFESKCKWPDLDRSMQ